MDLRITTDRHGRRWVAADDITAVLHLRADALTDPTAAAVLRLEADAIHDLTTPAPSESAA